MKKIVFIAWLSVFSACVTTPETGRKAFIITSESQENEMGVQAFKEVLATAKLSQDTRLNTIIQRVANRIAEAANQPEYQWEFKLIDSDEKNAFCLPGGKVAVYTGILPIAANEAGLATILGHEVGHATARHGGQRITMALGTQLGMAAVNAFLGGNPNDDTNQIIMGALGVGLTVGAALPFSRSNESEADQIGLIYMARAGYDPHEGPKVWQRFSEQGAGGSIEFLSTHPSNESRRAALEAQIERVLPDYERSPKVGLGETF
jgi:metalloendopeptidase OMA1, mitochondrial